MRPIIDVHCHLGQYAASATSADSRAPLHAVSPSGNNARRRIFDWACNGEIDLGNRYTLEETVGHDMLSAMIVAHPHHLAASKRGVAEAASNAKIVGVELHPVLGNYDILPSALLHLMEEVVVPSGLPVLSHVGNELPNVPIDRFLRMAARFPNIRFIAAHLGVGVLGLCDAAVNAWHETPLHNVWFYMGTLRVFSNGAVESLLGAAGPDRICFGTDAPLYVPAPLMRLLKTLGICEEVRHQIAWQNTLKVIPTLAGRAAADAD